jgi:hypothetical protein
MKYLTVLIISLFVASSSFGDESLDVTTLVSKIKDAKPSEKRVLINELKVKLRSMNQETKNEVMSQLRRSNNMQNTKSQHMNQNTHKNTSIKKQQNGSFQRKGQR